MDAREIAIDVISCGIWPANSWAYKLAAHVLRPAEPLGDAPYEDIRKARCVWCARGIPRGGFNLSYHVLDGVHLSLWPKCDCPSMEALQRAEVRRMQAELKEWKTTWREASTQQIADLRAQLAAAQQREKEAVGRADKAERDATYWMGCFDRMATVEIDLKSRISELEQASEARGQALLAAQPLIARCADWQCSKDDHPRCAFGLIKAALATPAATPAVACGCIPCRCEHETQCQGCGAKMCDRHKAERAATPAVEQSEAERFFYGLFNCYAQSTPAIDWYIGHLMGQGNYACGNCKDALHEPRPLDDSLRSDSAPRYRRSPERRGEGAGGMRIRIHGQREHTDANGAKCFRTATFDADCDPNTGVITFRLPSPAPPSEPVKEYRVAYKQLTTGCNDWIDRVLECSTKKEAEQTMSGLMARDAKRENMSRVHDVHIQSRTAPDGNWE